MSARVFIGIGSNIDPARNLPRALELLAGRFTLTGLSTVYLTTPIGHPEQEPYYNAVCSGTTNLGPSDFHRSVLRDVEHQVGRQRTEDRFAPRTIDLDLLLHDQCVMNRDGLVIPSPDITERDFVCLPLLELDSTLTMPDSGAQLATLTAQLNHSGMTPLHTYTRHLKETLRL